MSPNSFFASSWCKFPFDEAIENWAGSVLPYAIQARLDGAHRKWLRCGDTWFAGVNALPNDTSGVVGSSPPLSGAAIDFLRDELELHPLEFEPAQVSICYPGYPQPMPSETEAAFRYRRNRSAAHIDGILPEGESRRRHLREHHRFILGIPLTEYDESRSPLVVWEGSHDVVRQTLKQCFADQPPEQWGDIDITDIYKDMRNRIFDDCRQVEIIAGPGECYLVHRLALHGIAPWRDDSAAVTDSRIICYFRPETPSPSEWLNAP